MLADESLLQLMVVFKMRPLISDMVAIFNILKLGLMASKSDRVKIELLDMDTTLSKIILKSRSLNENLSHVEVEIHLLFTSPAVLDLDGKIRSFYFIFCNLSECS